VNKGERTRTQQMYKTDRCLKIIAIRKASPHIEKWQGVVQKKKKKVARCWRKRDTTNNKNTYYFWGEFAKLLLCQG